MNEELRTYIDILEFYAVAPVEEPQLLTEDIVAEDTRVLLRERLEDVVFKLRAHSESSDGDYALGFEQGLEMAAQMVENVLRIMGEDSGS